MDTKSKKWKSIVSYVVFILGISLLIGSGVFVLNRSQWYRYDGDSFQDDMKKAFETDYQNTDYFRREVADNLELLLEMATGGVIHQGFSGYGEYHYEDYYDDKEFDNETTAAEGAFEETVIEEAASTASAASEWYNYEDTESGGYSYADIETGESTYTPEENAKAAKRAHEYRKDDKNVLYTVTYENQVIFDNTDGAVLDGVKHILPEGYNFLLYFDGTRVTIMKDGKEIDVYQDGYYRENSDWYVPGYKNFTVDEKTKNATVCIAVAKEPMIYVKGNYGGDGAAEQNNNMYWIANNLRSEKRAYVSWIATIIVSILCLLVSVILHKDKKKGDYFFAKITGKVWFEAKLLILVILAVFTINHFFGLFDELYWVLMDGAAFEQGILLDYMSSLASNPVLLIIYFWLCYLLVNDVLYNNKVWKNSLTTFILGILRTKELKWTFQKKMVKRYSVILIIGFPVMVLTVLVMAVFMFNEELYILIPLIVVIIIWQGMQVAYANKNREVAENIGELIDHIKAIKNGNLTQKMQLPEDADLSEAACELNDIRQGMDAAVEKMMKSERMKVELLSNVSHDIKTPLTSIISYVELLKQEENLPEHIRDYVNILDNKSQRLKVMVQDVFDISKAVSGQLPLALETLDLRKLLWQTLADMEGQINNSAVSIKAEIPDEDLLIWADGQRLYRVFQNLIQNALQYSLEGSRVYVTLTKEENMAVASVKNTSKYEITKNKDYTERFTRGDESRTDGGSGLGLSIANSFTEACGGEFKMEAIADLFVVTVLFQLTK